MNFFYVHSLLDAFSQLHESQRTVAICVQRSENFEQLVLRLVSVDVAIYIGHNCLLQFSFLEEVTQLFSHIWSHLLLTFKLFPLVFSTLICLLLKISELQNPFVLERFLSRDALLGVLNQTSLNQLLYWFRNSVPLLATEVDRACHDLLNKLIVASGFKRRKATNQNVQDYPRWPHVCSSTLVIMNAFIYEYLRCRAVCFLERPQLFLYLLQTFDLQKNVPYLNTGQRILNHALLLQHWILHVKVFKLQVPMHQFPLLAVPDRNKNLLHDYWKFVFRHRFLSALQYQLDHWLVALFNSLHHSVHPAFALVHLMYFLNALLINWL